jgi:hypothetical protein
MRPSSRKAVIAALDPDASCSGAATSTLQPVRSAGGGQQPQAHTVDPIVVRDDDAEGFSTAHAQSALSCLAGPAMW